MTNWITGSRGEEVSITRRTAIWGTPAVLISAAAPAYADSRTPELIKCIPARVKSVRVEVKKTGKGKAARFTFSVNVSLREGLLGDIEVIVDGAPAYLDTKGKFLSGELKGETPLVQVRSCGRAIWAGTVGRDC